MPRAAVRWPAPGFKGLRLSRVPAKLGLYWAESGPVRRNPEQLPPHWVCSLSLYSQIFPHRSKPPQYSVDALLRLSKGISRNIFKSVNSEDASDASVGAWEGTLAEIEKGWLVEGTNPDLDKLVVARRFGLAQKLKVRVIDDFKQCGVNGSAGLPEKYVLYSIDAIAATMVRALSLDVPNGERLYGTTFDLVSAYKQYAIHPEDRERVRICVKDVNTGVAKVCKINTLPFGASGNVAGFLRISAALACIGQVGLGFWWSSFFDDFPTLTTSSLADQCKAQVHLLFDLLGIEFAREGDKAGSFEATFKALGLLIDLSEFSSGTIRIGHAESRKQELLLQIDQHLEQNCLKPKDAERLRGRLQWYWGITRIAGILWWIWIPLTSNLSPPWPIRRS